MKTALGITFVCWLFSGLAFGQAPESIQPAKPTLVSDGDRPVVWWVIQDSIGPPSCDQLPQYPGGELAFNDYLLSQLKKGVIPMDTIPSTGEYDFVLQLTLLENGYPSAISSVRSNKPWLVKNVLRILKSMPAWQAARLHNRPTKVTLGIRINYDLQKDAPSSLKERL